MLKKRLAILFVTLAYAVLLGHNIIPHHHHDSAQEIAEHHSSQHDLEGENDGLSHMLSHFVHSTDGFTFSPNHNLSSTFSKQKISFVTVLPNNFSFEEFNIPLLLLKQPSEKLIYISPISNSNSLRAPPATFI